MLVTSCAVFLVLCLLEPFYRGALKLVPDCFVCMFLKTPFCFNVHVLKSCLFVVLCVLRNTN